MTRYSALPSRERAALLDAKQKAFLDRLAHALESLGPDQKGNTPSCFRQRKGGRPPVPVRTKP